MLQGEKRKCSPVSELEKMKEEKTSQVQAKVGSQVEVNELSMHYHSKDVERGKDSENDRDLFTWATVQISGRWV